MKGIYKYTDLKTGNVVYVGKDSYIDKNARHKDHLRPSRYDEQQINRVLQNNPERYEYSVIWETDDCTTLKLNKMEILFGKIYNPKFNFGKFGKGGFTKHSEETKQKLKEINTGKNNPNYGNPSNYCHPEEVRQKISEANKGKPKSEKHKVKLSKAHKGKKISEKTKIKMSKSHNTTGYFRVNKHKCKSYNQGFYWEYLYYDEKGKRVSISSVDIKKLEKRIKDKGLRWERIEND